MTILLPTDKRYTLEQVGRKAYNLKLLKEAGFPTLNGVVLIPPLQEEEIKKVWNMFSAPQILAVRSSMKNEDGDNVSFAGKYETILGIRDFGTFKKSILKVINSSEVETQASVLIQPMNDNEISGVLFTKTKKSKNEIYIESCYGLGETLVSGMITPDRFLIDYDSLKITGKVSEGKSFGIFLERQPLKEGNLKKYSFGYTKKVISMGKGKFLGSIPYQERNKFSLNQSQILQLCDIAKKIESFFDYPQDIEWGLKGSKIVILQTRPITSFINLEIFPSKKNKESLHGIIASPGIIQGKVVTDFNDITSLDDKLIYVGYETKPELLYHLNQVKGIITENGGVLCHASIVARELNIPCLVGVKFATDYLKHGMLITLDATKGCIILGKENKQ